MTILKKDFNYNLFSEALNDYLTYLAEEYSKYSKIVTDNRIITRQYLDNIDNAIKDNVDIKKMEEECDFLSNKIVEIKDKTVKLSIFSSTFPENINIETGTILLEDIREFFIKSEQYEKCILLQEVIDLLKK